MITDVNLGHHGDAGIAPGLVGLAVNVRRREPPGWLTAKLACTLRQSASYPDPAPATVAARHRRRAGEVLLTSGAAERSFSSPGRCARDVRWSCIPSSPNPKPRCVPPGTGCGGSSATHPRLSPGQRHWRASVARVAVRDPATSEAFTDALREVL
jgi:histidinol-phosphate/aromatic aminotransferase/cobyric acid decarboxylase-like protein